MPTSHARHLPSGVFFSTAFLAIAFLIGCEQASEDVQTPWSNSNSNSSSSNSSSSNSSSSNSSSSGSSSNSSSGSSSSRPSSNSSSSNASSNASKPNTESGKTDAVSFGSLKWSYGGINGSGAKKTSASIGGLRFTRAGLSYSWTGPNLSSWGLSNSDTSAYACLFVKKADGSWVGGKFDWVSSSRTSRDFKNIFEGYHGWSLSGVPNPCDAAFVIVSGDLKKRTNVLVGKWAR